jgi:S-adenosyl-L-methionine hydrolase (adenosine-forming)
VETLTRPIFLLTDFGIRDHHVGQVRAVISAISPAAPIHDITHDVDPFAVDHGAWLLETTIPALPPNAVVMAVVDPGVGTARRGIVVSSNGRHFLGPDNGVLSAALREKEGMAVEITAPDFRRATVASTFHARDIFAPAAAHLAAGLSPQRLGRSLAEPRLLAPFSAVDEPGGCLRGYVIHVDRFGNLITTVHQSQLPYRFQVEAGGRRIADIVRTFADAPEGLPVCYVDSSGFLAVALNKGNAARSLGVRRGESVLVHRS